MEIATMSAINSRGTRIGSTAKFRQDGVAAVEFALVVSMFLLLVFGIIEFARLMYMYNTLAEVTRSAARAATNIAFTDGNALNLARKRAVFNEATGSLPFGSPITWQHIRIEYMYLALTAGGRELQVIPPGSMPTSPAQNRVNCITDPTAGNCIRAVQVRICQEGTAAGACSPVPYQTLMPLISLPLRLPRSLTIVTAETLGYQTGDTPGG
jgi:hypothetical protein